MIWQHLKQPELASDAWPWLAALALLGPAAIGYVFRWLSKGVIERRTVPLILVAFGSLLFGLLFALSPLLPSHSGGNTAMPFQLLSMACLAFVNAALLVIALIAKV